MRYWMSALVVAVVTAGVLSLDAQQAAPDIVLTNGKIITVDDQFSIAQAVAVRGDRIVAVGTNQAITQMAGPKTRRIDLRGRSVVPGMIDNHAHFQEEGAYWTLELRFDGVDSRKQALEMIRAKAKAAGPASGCSTSAAGRPISSRTTRSRSLARNWTRCPPTTRCSSSSRDRRSTSTARRSMSSGSSSARSRGSARRERARDRNHRRRRAATRCSTQAGFLDAPNGGKANLPMDVIVASQKVMLRDLAKAGLTASGGQCLWEDLYRQFQKEGTASMRFFCQKTVAGGGRGAGAQEKMIAQLPMLRFHDGDEWMDNSNYGERFPGGGGGDVIAPGPEPDCRAGSVGRLGPLRARGCQGRYPRPAPLRDGDRYRRTAHAAREDEQGGRTCGRSAGRSCTWKA